MLYRIGDVMLRIFITSSREASSNVALNEYFKSLVSAITTLTLYQFSMRFATLAISSPLKNKFSFRPAVVLFRIRYRFGCNSILI